jgi:hypothetical protein
MAHRYIIYLLAAFVLVAPSAALVVPSMPEAATYSDAILETAACPSGHSAARLTGWMLNGKRPVGTAKYNEATKTLEVEVKAVALPDGKRLNILIGDDRIGEMEPLEGGSARVVLMRALRDKARVRVFDEDRPLVSANLKCVAAPTPAPTPMPTATPTPPPTPTPSPTPVPEPTLLPTPDPMPKDSPHPTPSPMA